MLEHELWHVVGTIHELDQVFLHDSVLVCGRLESRYRAIPIPSHASILVDVVHALASRKCLEEGR